MKLFPLFTPLALTFTLASAADVYHAQGELAGEVTATAVLLQTRLTALPGSELDDAADVHDAFFAWAKEQGIGSLITFCGDRHWQYHSIHPSGVEEFSCGALIKQPYTYKTPTGGFLHVATIVGPNKAHSLRIRHYDDTGAILYEITKAPK